MVSHNKRYVTDGRANNQNRNHPLRIDRDALHRVLSHRVDHFGRIKINLGALAEETGVNYSNLSGIIGQMAAEGRLRKVGGTQQGAKTYLVTDPKDWAATAEVS